jgi:hypothetical protein
MPQYQTSGDTKLLNRASVPVALLNGVLADPSHKTWGQVNHPDTTHGDGPEGIQVLGDYAAVTGSVYYDAGTSQDKSLLLVKWPITDPENVEALPWRSVKGFGEGWVAGPMTLIPERWRAALKGDVFVGQPGGLPIIGRQSFGPCGFSIRAKDLLTVDDVDATLLVGYQNNQTWQWKWSGPANDFFNSATEYNAVTFIGDDVVFIGRHGYGEPCYGGGTSDPSQVGPGMCFDPTTESKGTHAYPYRLQGLGYRVQELADVAAGKLKPHEPTAFWFPIVVPYFEHQHYKQAPGTIPKLDVIGADYDSEAQRLYVGIRAQDSYGYEPGPLIHALSVESIPRFPNAGPVLVRSKAPPIEPPVEPTDRDQLREEIAGLKEDLRVANEQLTIVESQRVELATELQNHRAAVSQFMSAFDQLRNL